MIPYGRQDISQDDIDAVVEVLRSDFLTQGPVVPKFEEIVSTYCSVQHALAVNSSTSALHRMPRSRSGSGIGFGLVPNLVASSNCALYCGAQVDFVDIDPLTYNLCPKALERKLLVAERWLFTKSCYTVHLCGQCCVRAIYSLAQRFNFKIIEDASHAIAAVTLVSGLVLSLQ